jgi:hypothetical protein
MSGRILTCGLQTPLRRPSSVLHQLLVYETRKTPKRYKIAKCQQNKGNAKERPIGDDSTNKHNFLSNKRISTYFGIILDEYYNTGAIFEQYWPNIFARGKKDHWYTEAEIELLYT